MHFGVGLCHCNGSWINTKLVGQQVDNIINIMMIAAPRKHLVSIHHFWMANTYGHSPSMRFDTFAMRFSQFEEALLKVTLVNTGYKHNVFLNFSTDA